MATKHTLKRGSTRPVLRYPLPGVDLTGATATFLMSPRPGQPPTVNAPAVVTYGALEYHWQSGDTDQAVTHFGEFEVTFADGSIETFPNDDYIRIEVKQDIGDGGTVAPPALIVLTGALIEAGTDAVSGAGAVAIALSGALVDTGSDTAAGTGTVTTPTPGSISLSAALIEAGADTASGTASLGITASAALVETGSDTAAGTGTVADTPPDAVVVIGASLMNAMFGKDLTTPHSMATSLLAGLGHNLPVYGYATSGVRMDAADDHYSAARAAHPNAIIIAHFGGNDVTADRPYPGGQAIINTGLANLKAAAGGDPKFYPASLTFRDYDDLTFQDPSRGSKLYNDNLILPWIAANYPHAMAPYGRPKLDFYRRSLQSFDTWLSADNVHMTTGGYTAFREWIIGRVAEVLSGQTPTEVPERVYVPPVTPPPSTAPVIVNFYRNTQQTGANNISLYSVLDVTRTGLVDNTGAATGVAVHCYHTGNPISASGGSTTDPAAGINSSGITTGVPSAAGQLFATAVLGESWFVTATPTGVVDITGLEPGAQYEIGVVGSRTAADARTTEVTVGGQSVSWNTTESPPQERKVQVTASPTGTLQLIFRAINGTLFAYLGGFSLRRLT